MNKTPLLTLAGIVAVTLITGLVVGRYIVPSGSGAKPSAPSAAPVAVEAEPTIWTCSMHPQIQQPDPGDCPICGMDLIPLVKESGADDGPRTMSMSESSRALADIQTTVVERGFPTAKVHLVGKLDYDETREKSLTARFPARIDDLYVNFKGIPVKKGEHLALVYSPELLIAQRELLTAHRSDPNSSITRAAREKLRLWDLLPEQIDEIIEGGEATDQFVLRAPISGVVVAKNVKEGDYVKTGETLFRIVDLSELWLFLNAFESDLAWLRYGQDVAFSVEAFPGEAFHGTIVFIEPEVDRKTRTVPVRVNVPNPDGRLKPGMFARGTVEARVAENGKIYAPELSGKWISPMHPEIVKDGPGQCDVCGMDLVPAETLGYVDNSERPAPLVVPSSAVLRTGRRAVVYIEIPDTDRPTFEGREVVLGPRAGDYFLVNEGLEEGDRVVTHGAFKIDSALQIQAKPSMMSVESADPVDEESAITGLPAGMAVELIPEYLDLQAALAGDNIEAAEAALKAMMTITGHQGMMAELIHTMLSAGDLEGIRRPHFETLSNALIAEIRAHPSVFEGDLYLMHCPMVYGETGADWIQSTGDLLNPYFGAMMLRCGEVREQLVSEDSGHADHAH